MKLGGDRSEGDGSMAGYQIIHIENKWIVCFEQTRLISFDRKWKAQKTMHIAARLIEGPYSRRANVLASPQECAKRRQQSCEDAWSNRCGAG
jgi:hypothetical protein